MSQLFSFREEITNVLEDDDAEVAENVLDMTETQLQQGTAHGPQKTPEERLNTVKTKIRNILERTSVSDATDNLMDE